MYKFNFMPLLIKNQIRNKGEKPNQILRKEREREREKTGMRSARQKPKKKKQKSKIEN